MKTITKDTILEYGTFDDRNDSYDDTNESKEETDYISLDAAKALKEYSKNQGYKIGEILSAVLGREVGKITDITHSELRDVEMWLKQNPR